MGGKQEEKVYVLMKGTTLLNIECKYLKEIVLDQAAILGRMYTVDDNKHEVKYEQSEKFYDKIVEERHRQPLVDIIVHQCSQHSVMNRSMIDLFHALEATEGEGNKKKEIFTLKEIKTVADALTMRNAGMNVENLMKKVPKSVESKLVFAGASSSSRDTGAINELDCTVIRGDDKGYLEKAISSNIPRFGSSVNENSLDDWVWKVDMMAKRFGLNDVEVIPHLISKVEGNVLQLLKNLLKEDPDTDWQCFQDCLRKEYLSASSRRNLLSELTSLNLAKLGNNFMKYVEKYHTLINRLGPLGLSEELKMHHFIGGLHPNMQTQVLSHNPLEVKKAIELARVANDCYLKRDKNVAKINSARTSQNFRNYNSNSNYRKHNHNAGKDKQSNFDSSKTNNFNKDRKPFKPFNGSRSNNYKNTSQNNNSNNNYNGNSNNKTLPKCDLCRRVGHYKNQCRLQKINYCEVERDESAGNTEEYHHVSNMVNVFSATNEGKHSILSVIGEIDGIRMRCVLDSGATASLISLKQVHKFSIEILPTNLKIKTADNAIVPAIGITNELSVDICDHLCRLKFIIIEHDDHEILLGLDWFSATGAGIFPSEKILKFPSQNVYLSEEESDDFIEAIQTYDVNEEESAPDEIDWRFSEDCNNIKLPKELTLRQKDDFKLMINEMGDAFSLGIHDLGRCTIAKHQIKLKEDTVPVNKPPYRISHKDREFLKEEIEVMLKFGIVRRSTSPWSAPVVIIPKKDGSRRICIDYRLLNSVTITQNFPVPQVQDIFETIAQAIYFSTLDLASGYWQELLEDNSKEYTAFSTPDGHYEFEVLPFGLKNAPSDFNRVMQLMLRRIENNTFVIAYFDDIIIYSRTYEEHLIHLKIVLETLISVNLKLKPSKCNWCQTEAKVLGHVISEGKILMDPDKISSIVKREPPRNVKQLQSFLGICNYYRKFVEGYAKKAAPLNKLLSKEVKFVWSQDQQEAFELLKNALVKYPILRVADFKRPFTIFTDASNYALGAVLTQIDDQNREYVVAYASRTLNTAEKNYGISEKECLAVIYAIKQFRVYVHGTTFKLITDHSALTWLLNIRDPTGRLARWALYIQAFDVEIIHRKGVIHCNADTLSRPPIEDACTVETRNDEDAYLSIKSVDPYEDDALLQFLKTGKHMSGVSYKRAKGIEKLAKIYSLGIDNLGQEALWYKKDEKILLVPKPQERKELVLQAHLLGHFQAQTTLKRLQELYYWKGMHEDSKKVCEECDNCRRTHKPNLKEHPFKSLSVDGVHDRVQIDLVFGFPESEDGYKGILTVIEAVTKNCSLFPIRSKEAQEIAKCLWKYISVYSAPRVILSDRGTEFCNKVVDHLLRMSGIEHRVTAAYHPRTNGLTERQNATVVSAIRAHATENKLKWPEWLEYIELAYRTRIHSTTNYSPFELLYGRSPNTFRSWIHSEPNLTEEQESEALWQRAMEIKQMVEYTHEKAKNNILKSQEQTKKLHLTKSKTTTIELEPGSQVMISTTGMHPKLHDPFRGPFTVIERTAAGTYRLMNVKNEILDDTYSLERLKPVSTIEHHKYHNYTDILDHRVNSKGKNEYLVRWKNEFDPDTWEPAENFPDTHFIDEYWKKVKKNESPTKTQPRLKLNLKLKPNTLATDVATVPKKRGRPPNPKINQFSLLICLCILSLFLSGLSAQIVDSFHFCSEVMEINGQTKVINPDIQCNNVYDLSTDHTFDIKERVKDTSTIEAGLLKANITKENYEYTIIEKLHNVVNDKGFECVKKMVKVGTFVNFFGARSEDPIEEFYTKLSREDCEYMVKHQQCNGMPMNCDEGTCIFDGTPPLKYVWMYGWSKDGIYCKTRPKLVIANTIQTKLFGKNCIAENGQCQLDNSIIIWNKTNYADCPMRKIVTLNLTLFPNNVLYSNVSMLAFKINNNFEFERTCESIHKEGIPMFKTMEGLFISGHTKATNLPLSEMDPFAIHDLLLGGDDGHRFTELMELNAVRKRVCNNRVAFVRTLARSPDYFEYLPDEDDTITIIYSKDGIIVAPMCTPIKSITLGISDECIEDIPVNLTINKKVVTAFMQPNRIIKSKTKRSACIHKHAFLPKSKGYISFNGKESKVFYDLKSIYNISTADAVDWDKMNFPHLSELFHETDILHDIYTPATVENAPNFNPGGAESSFFQTGILSNISNAWKTSKLYLLIITVSIIVLIFLVFLFKVCNICERWSRIRSMRHLRRSQYPRRDIQMELIRQATGPTVPSLTAEDLAFLKHTPR